MRLVVASRPKIAALLVADVKGHTTATILGRQSPALSLVMQVEQIARPAIDQDRLAKEMKR